MTTFGSFLICVLTWMTITERSSLFLLDGQTKCIAFPPCTCERYFVRCASNSLVTFPNFKPSNVTRTELHIQIYSNTLTNVPTGSFQNLTVSNATSIHLSLVYSNLNSIATNAFKGIDHNIVSLELQYNNFTTVPSELATLANLETLNLLYNPISSLNYNTMYIMGRSLKDLSIDLKYIHEWPGELNLLTSLAHLGLQHVSLTYLDYDVFDAFVNTLESLKIDYSQLARVPAAVCRLNKLKIFGFSYNGNIHVNSPLFEPCYRNLTTVSQVYLNGNNLKYMPNVLFLFPSISSIMLNNNKLSYIHWDTIPDNSPMTSIYLSNNNFTRVPSVINKFRQLGSLHVDSNKIGSIEYMDLNQLSKLRWIEFQQNPIVYISPIAFKNNLQLMYINLKNTLLHQLPSSLAALHNLQHLYLSGSPIECNCGLSYLNTMNVTQITMDGNCEIKPISIKAFLTFDLQKCP